MAQSRIDELGGTTVAAARAGNLAPEIAAAIGFRVRRVRRHLEQAHGATLVRNAFADAWSEHGAGRDSEADDLDELGDTTIAAAREDGLAPQIAKVTGLRVSTVRSAMHAAHGRALVRNVFEEDWPAGIDDVDEAESDDDLDALGEMTAAAAREFLKDIAQVTGLRVSEVRRALEAVHGKTLLRNVFPEHWSNGTFEDFDEQPDSEPVPVRARLQGRPKHQAMQRSLVELGELKGYHVRTNHAIGAGFKPDVLWYRLNPSEHVNAAPIAAFEVEFGSSQAIAKSLGSLKHAYDLASPNLFLILPADRVESAKLRLNGAFHEIQKSIRVLPIESMTNLTFPQLAKRLGL